MSHGSRPDATATLRRGATGTATRAAVPGTQRYGREFSPTDVTFLRKAVVCGQQRAESLTAEKKPRGTRYGKLVPGYISSVDGSVQPYGVVVSKKYDGLRPWRLDVILYRSTRSVEMSELKFITRSDSVRGSAPEFRTK